MSFFKRWMSMNESKALRAVKRVKNLAKLIEISKTAPLPIVKNKALERLSGIICPYYINGMCRYGEEITIRCSLNPVNFNMCYIYNYRKTGSAAFLIE